MDTALPIDEQNLIRDVLEPHRQSGVEYHALRTRQSGSRRFVSLHILVPGMWNVQRGHQLAESIEEDIRRALPNVIVFTHLESLSDPASWDDGVLDHGQKPGVDTTEEQPRQSQNGKEAKLQNQS
jgi:divalent metal cation (Fe/Co/Zn/Cd) transporter